MRRKFQIKESTYDLWKSNNASEPLTFAKLKAAVDKFINSKIEYQPDIEWWYCKKGCLSGTKMLGVKIKCPKCNGDVKDFAWYMKKVYGR